MPFKVNLLDKNKNMNYETAKFKQQNCGIRKKKLKITEVYPWEFHANDEGEITLNVHLCGITY